MKDVNIYMITCDKTNHVLNVSIPLWDKYWNTPKSVKILGFNKPNVDLPLEYEFISMKPEQLSIDDWCKDIHSVISKDPNEFVIFTLDDFLPIDYVNTKILEFFYGEFERDPNLVRCALGIDLSYQPHRVLRSYGNFSTIEQSQTSPYRITTQPSIWRKDYLLHFLNKSTNPWNLETQNNPIDGKVILGTIGEHAFRYIEESALSGRHPNKFNVLGMRFSDVRWLLDNALVDKDKLQFGQHIGEVPQFNQYGFSFNLEVLKNYVNADKYLQYLEKYGKFYESIDN